MFENELENIGNMYMKMAIHTMHTDTITKHAYIYAYAQHLLYTHTFTIYGFL